MHWEFGEMEFGEMKRNTSNWSNFGMLLRRAGLTASAGLSCLIVPGHCGCVSCWGENRTNNGDGRLNPLRGSPDPINCLSV